MPILRGAATFARFRVEPDGKTTPNWKKTLPAGLKARAFAPLDRAEPNDRSAGFVELEDTEARAFSAGSIFNGEHAIFSWRVDEFRIPAAALRRELERWAKEFEKQNGRNPGRREKADAKADLRHQLRQRAPIAVKTFDVSWNLTTGQLQVWAAARKVVDEVQTQVEDVFKVKLVPLAPAAVAVALGIPEKALAPTPGLSLPAKTGVARGEA